MKVTQDTWHCEGLKVSLNGSHPSFVIEADEEAGYVICHRTVLGKYGGAIPTEETVTYYGEVCIMAPLMVPLRDHPHRWMYEESADAHTHL
jgi:hypothetical protein